MSRPGDVVWADGRAWMRTDWDEKSRWITESIARPENRTTLKALKQHDDFRWLVRDGYRQINDYPLAHEAYRFQIANLTELLAQAEKERDAAAKGYLEKVSELEDIRAELSGWSIWKTDEPEPPLAEQVRTLRDAWRDVANERDNAKRILLDKTAFEEEVTKAANEERAAIVAWLVGYGLPQVANQIDNGLHLAGDDE